MSARIRAVLFNFADFQNDLNVTVMSHEEVGMYMRLLCLAMSEDPQGTLPNDHAVLAKALNVSPKKFEKISKIILRPFKSDDSGRLRQKRLMEELENARKISSSQSERAKKRWQQNKTHESEFMPGHSRGIAAAPPNECRGNAMLGNATETETETRTVVEEESSASAAIFSDEEWIEGLKTNPDYAGIPVDRVVTKCRKWCKDHGKDFIRDTVEKWLKTEKKPISGIPATQLEKPKNQEPERWREVLHKLYPEERDLQNAIIAFEIPSRFESLPESVRFEIRDWIKQNTPKFGNSDMA